jgi:hypothetical protein
MDGARPSLGGRGSRPLPVQFVIRGDGLRAVPIWISSISVAIHKTHRTTEKSACGTPSFAMPPRFQDTVEVFPPAKTCTLLVLKC